MFAPAKLLSALPPGLRDPLLDEHRRIIQNYMERRWLPSELSGGRFCEIVYSILDGYSTGTFASAPNKPGNFVQACRALENNASVPRSFQILIPRMLPALYEVRNNRGVGHVGGDVDPNHMDATVVLGMVNWIMAELVRVFHQLPIHDAQRVVDQLVERRIPIVWQIGDVKRVLDTSLKLSDQVLLLIATCPAGCTVDQVYHWTGYHDRGYFLRLIRKLHAARMIELADDEKSVEVLPPGASLAEDLVRRKAAV